MCKLECDLFFYQVNSLVHETWYIIYSALGSFYIPFLLLSIIYLKIFIRVRAPIKETQKQLIEESKYFSLKPEAADKTTFAATNGAINNNKKNSIKGLSLVNEDTYQNSEKREEIQNNLKSVTYYGKDLVSINGFKNNINRKQTKNKGLLYQITFLYNYDSL